MWKQRTEWGRKAVRSGKTGLLDEIRDVGMVHPSCGEDQDPGSRRSHLGLPQASKERELWTKDRIRRWKEGNRFSRSKLDKTHQRWD